jgi:hypothetical protein
MEAGYIAVTPAQQHGGFAFVSGVDARKGLNARAACIHTWSVWLPIAAGNGAEKELPVKLLFRFVSLFGQFWCEPHR